MLISKIFDEAVEHHFEILSYIVKNKISDEIDEKLLSPYELRFMFAIPSMTEDSFVEVTPIFYKEIKKHDIHNLINLTTGYSYDNEYTATAISFNNEPLHVRKFLINEGSAVRLGLQDSYHHESSDEYAIKFKDIKYLDIFIDQLKILIKDPAFAPVTKDMFL